MIRHQQRDRRGNRHATRRRTCLAGLAAVLIGAAAVAGPAAPAPGLPALEWAWQFASAIEIDPGDQARAQEQVLRDYLSVGAVDEALSRVATMRHWRQGIVWAEVALARLDQGRTNDAAAAIQRLEQLQRGMTPGWQSDRLSAYLARAYARIGLLASSQDLAGKLPPEEVMRAHGLTAATLAAAGRFTEALALLGRFDGQPQLDTRLGLVQAYLALARQPAVSSQPERHRQVLAACRPLLPELPVLLQADVAPALAEEYGRAGDPAGARAVLAEVERLIRSAAPESWQQAPALARLARAWTRLGERDRATALLQEAAALAPTGDPMYQPAACAEVAAVVAQTGAVDDAWRLYEQGLNVAAGFRNARPRALQLTEVCRLIGRAGLSLPPELTTRLEQLHAGLQAPW